LPNDDITFKYWLFLLNYSMEIADKIKSIRLVLPIAIAIITSIIIL